MRILVTGHKGFIGSHVFRALKADGHEVVGQDWPDDLVSLVKGDVLDAVVNLAALGGAGRAQHHPWHVINNNVAGTINLRAHCAALWKPRVVHVSSFSVYGDAPVPTTEDAPLRPKELYGASKLMQELCWTGYPGPLTILRLSSVYGPGMRIDDPEATVIAKIAKAAYDCQPFNVFEDGLQTRDFVHVDDVVRMVRVALTHTNLDREINVCSGVGTSILDACYALGVAPIITGKARPGDMRHCRGDTTRFSRVCGDPHPFTPRDILEPPPDSWRGDPCAGS